MSSSSGPRAAGSDGSDFSHRERVAAHYTTSAVNKYRLKLMCFLHIFSCLICLIKVSPTLLKLINVSTPKFILGLGLPPPENFEYIWLFSIQASIFCLISLPRNNTILLKQYIVGMLVFGFMPIGYAVYAKGFELLDYVSTGVVKSRFHGFPMVVLWYMFFTVMIQVQGFGIYFAKQLLGAWTTRGDRSKKTR